MYNESSVYNIIKLKKNKIIILSHASYPVTENACSASHEKYGIHNVPT